MLMLLLVGKRTMNTAAKIRANCESLRHIKFKTRNEEERLLVRVLVVVLRGATWS